MANPGPKPGTRPSGRPKGAPNKSTLELRAAIAAACGSEWDPLVEMARIGKTGLVAQYDPATGEPMIEPLTGRPVLAPVSEKNRIHCCKEVSEYIHAKRKAVEMSGVDGDPIEVVAHNDVKAVETLTAMLGALGDEV